MKVLCTCCGTATTVLVIIEYIRGPTASSTTIRLVSLYFSGTGMVQKNFPTKCSFCQKYISPKVISSNHILPETHFANFHFVIFS